MSANFRTTSQIPFASPWNFLFGQLTMTWLSSYLTSLWPFLNPLCRHWGQSFLTLRIHEPQRVWSHCRQSCGSVTKLKHTGHDKVSSKNLSSLCELWVSDEFSRWISLAISSSTHSMSCWDSKRPRRIKVSSVRLRGHYKTQLVSTMSICWAYSRIVLFFKRVGSSFSVKFTT